MSQFQKTVAPRVGLPKSGDSNRVDSSADHKTVTQSRRVAEELSSGSAMPDSSENITALLPCPFCGGEARLADNTGPKLCTAAHAFVFCIKRGCPGSGDEQNTVAEAIAAWNTRAPLYTAPQGSEREAIVAWLRGKVAGWRSAAEKQGKRVGSLVAGVEYAADAIERGEHLPPPPTDNGGE